MTNVLIVGCGDIGGEVAQLLTSAGYGVTGVRVSNKPLPANIECIRTDVTHATSILALETLRPHVVIYCVAANAQTDDSYRLHYVDGLRHVLKAQAHNENLKHVFFVSSTRVYGQNTQDLIDESMPALPRDFGGKRLLEAEQLLASLSCGHTAIRLSGIYGPNRQYLLNLAKTPQRWPNNNKWTNRIHREDAARFIAFLCKKVNAGKPIADCYIGTDDMPTLQFDVLSWLASALGIAYIRPSVDGEVSGKRLSNQRMHEAGFALKYVNYQVGYSEILKNV